MNLLIMLDDKIEQLRKEWFLCSNEVEKAQIAYARNELKILKYEYLLKSGIIKPEL